MRDLEIISEMLNIHEFHQLLERRQIIMSLVATATRSPRKSHVLARGVKEKVSELLLQMRVDAIHLEGKLTRMQESLLGYIPPFPEDSGILVLGDPIGDPEDESDDYFMK